MVKKRILFIDDEKANIITLTHILSAEYTVHAAKNGNDGIKLAEKYLPDVILLDIRMPEMDGYEVLSALKNSKKTQDIPVIFITGLNKADDEEKGLTLGAADYITKPFSSAVVKLRIRNQIKILEQRMTEKALWQANAANKAKSNFLAMMSHEIRTPLNAILGIDEILLQNKNIEPGIKEELEKIYNSGKLLLGIINNILDLSKIEAGKLELIPTEYNVASLINDTTTLNVMRISSKPINFELFVDENTPSILFGDALRIKQILNNLLSNSFKYTDKGTVKLSVIAERADKKKASNVTLVFRVEDTGQGMTEEQISRMFNEYSRFNLEANCMTEGTGLGMSITQNLVRLMNGKISVESKLKKGTEFIVHLPQKRIGSDVLGRELAENLQMFRMSGMNQIRRAQIEFDPMPYGNVLVVDDVESNLYVTKGLLAPYELTVDTVMSGIEAINKIKDGKVYDIVFMDYMMPKMDGIETAKIIRDLGYKHPIIALTANALVGQAEIFMANGFNGFISKPIDVHELNAILKKFIQDKQPPEVIALHRQEGREKHITDETPAVTSQLAKIFIRDAGKAIEALEVFKEKHAAYKEEDIHSYTINAHSIKSALTNIGETELSAAAAKLEQAGRDKDIALMLSETQTFLSDLRTIIEKLTPQNENNECSETADYDCEYLREKLLTIKNACQAYDKKTVKNAVTELMQKTWPGAIKELLDTMAVHLLHSEFEDVFRLAEMTEEKIT